MFIVEIIDPPREPITREINGIKVFPFGLDNKGFVRIDTEDPVKAAKLVSSKYSVPVRSLRAITLSKNDPLKPPKHRR